MVTGDEKQMVFNNVKHEWSWGKHAKLPQTISEVVLQPKVVIFSISWDWKSVVFYKLLTINLDMHND